MTTPEHDEQQAPAGWDRIEGGEEFVYDPTPIGPWKDEPDGEPDVEDEFDAGLRRAELENERADIDLGRQRLALDERRLDQDRHAAENDLRIAALQTARSLVTDHRYATPVEAAKELGQIHRAVLRMLVEPLPAPKPRSDALDEAQRVPGNPNARYMVDVVDEEPR